MMYACNYITDINEFYKRIDQINFNDIPKEKIDILREESILINEFYNNEQMEKMKSKRYLKVMRKVRSNFKLYNLSNFNEVYLLFMLSVDPNLEATMIYEENNKLNRIINQIEKYFGLPDKDLVKIEREYIKVILSKEEKNQLQKRIEKRVFN